MKKVGVGVTQEKELEAASALAQPLEGTKIELEKELDHNEESEKKTDAMKKRAVFWHKRGYGEAEAERMAESEILGWNRLLDGARAAPKEELKALADEFRRSLGRPSKEEILNLGSLEKVQKEAEAWEERLKTLRKLGGDGWFDYYYPVFNKMRGVCAVPYRRMDGQVERFPVYLWFKDVKLGKDVKRVFINFEFVGMTDEELKKTTDDKKILKKHNKLKYHCNGLVCNPNNRCTGNEMIVCNEIIWPFIEDENLSFDLNVFRGQVEWIYEEDNDIPEMRGMLKAYRMDFVIKNKKGAYIYLEYDDKGSHNYHKDDEGKQFYYEKERNACLDDAGFYKFEMTDKLLQESKSYRDKTLKRLKDKYYNAAANPIKPMADNRKFQLFDKSVFADLMPYYERIERIEGWQRVRSDGRYKLRYVRLVKSGTRGEVWYVRGDGAHDFTNVSWKHWIKRIWTRCPVPECGRRFDPEGFPGKAEYDRDKKLWRCDICRRIFRDEKGLPGEELTGN